MPTKCDAPSTPGNGDRSRTAVRRRTVLAAGAALGSSATVGCLDGRLEAFVDERFGDGADVHVAIVSSPAGFGDDGVTDEALAGLEVAAATYGVEVDVVEETEPGRYQGVQEILAEEGYDLIVCVGASHREGLEANVEAYPDQRWMLVGDHVDGAATVSGWIPRKNQAAFLAGVAAGTATSEPIEYAGRATNPDERVVGFIAADVDRGYSPLERSYVEGVEWVDAGAEVLTGYAGNFSLSLRMREAAEAQYERGADVVYHVGSGRRVSVFRVAQEYDRFALGSNVDQSVLDDAYADVILGSAVTAHGVATYRVAEAVVEDDWDRVRGDRYLGVETGGVDFVVGQAFDGGRGPGGILGDADATAGRNEAVELPASLHETVAAASDAVAAGEVVLPCDPGYC